MYQGSVLRAHSRLCFCSRKFLLFFFFPPFFCKEASWQKVWTCSSNWGDCRICCNWTWKNLKYWLCSFIKAFFFCHLIVIWLCIRALSLTWMPARNNIVWTNYFEVHIIIVLILFIYLYVYFPRHCLKLLSAPVLFTFSLFQAWATEQGEDLQFWRRSMNGIEGFTWRTLNFPSWVRKDRWVNYGIICN